MDVSVRVDDKGRMFFAAPKTTDEVSAFAIDFALAMVLNGESFSAGGVQVKVYQRGVPAVDLTPTMLVPGSITASGTVAGFQIQGGVDGENFVAQVNVSTSASRVERAQVIFPVRNRPYEAYGNQILSVEEILDDLNLDAVQYLRVEALLNAASNTIERHCHTIFRKQTITKKFTGRPFPILDLGAPVIGLPSDVSILHDAVLQTFDTLDPSTYTVMNERGQLFRYYGWTYFSAIGTPSPATWFFLPNMFNVKVTATFGWDPIPADVANVCLSLVRFWNSIRGREGLLEERMGEYTYRTQLGGRSSAGNVEQDGIPTEILAHLDFYIRHPV